MSVTTSQCWVSCWLVQGCSRTSMRLGEQPGRLDIAVDVLDGYGAVRDLAGLTPEILGSENEWRLGTHSGTFADREAGGQLDGSERIGLRGAPVALLGQP